MNSQGRGREVPAAERMRAHRLRRRNGLRSVRLLLHETEIDQLVKKGFLEPEDRHNENAVSAAMEAFVSDALSA